MSVEEPGCVHHEVVWVSQPMFNDLQGTMFITTAISSTVQFLLRYSKRHIKMMPLLEADRRQWHKPAKKMLSFPLQSLRISIKLWASLFPFFADSVISVSARSALWFIPRPCAHHFASNNIASASPRATHSSRREAALASFFSTPSPSINLFASSLFASMCPCAADASNSSKVCVLALFSSITFLCVWKCDWVQVNQFSSEKKGRKKKDKKGFEEKRKKTQLREKRQKELPGGELNPGQPCDRRLY